MSIFFFMFYYNIYSDASKFDNKNRLKVTPELLLVGESNIYAIGDCCNTSEEKLASHACAHARTAAHNIWRDIKGKAKKPYVQSKYTKHYHRKIRYLTPNYG